MKFVLRWKKQLLALAVIATACVVLWGAFVFVAMWLRIRCVRELASQARQLDEVGIYDHLNPEVVAVDWDGDLNLLGLDVGTRRSDLVVRLEELQRPSIRTVLRQMFGQWTNHDQIVETDLIPSIAFSGINSLTAVSVTDEQTNESSSPLSIDLTVTQPVNVTSGQFLLSLWNSAPSINVYSVTDTTGESLIVVTHAVSAIATENQEPEQP